MKDVFLNPGEWFAGDRHHRVRTLLGSCVSITLWHPHLKVGAMSHSLLTTRGSPSESRDGRYVDEALWLMLDALAALGAAAPVLEAKVFGGGDMFPAQAGKNGLGLRIGQRNGEAAKQLLAQAGIAVRSESLFGVGHRKIMFDIGSGHVWSFQSGPAAMSDKS